MDIVNTKSFDVVLILGGFHTMTSFVGSIGALMKGFVLSECLETEFGANTVPKIIDGKAISWAVRAHFLTEGSLMAKLLATFVSGTDTEFEETETEKNEETEENLELNEITLMLYARKQSTKMRNGKNKVKTCILKDLEV